MSRRHVPVHHSTLDSVSLGPMLGRLYPLRRPFACRLYKAAGSDIYIVTSAGRTYWLKVYPHGYRSRREILAEVDLLDRLAGRGVAVAKAVRRRDGRGLCTLRAPEGVRYAVLFDDALGEPVAVKDATTVQSRAFGAMAGRMHKAMDTIRTAYPRRHLDLTYLIEGSLGHIEPFLACRRGDFDYLRRVADDLAHRVNELVSSNKSTYGLCHGDLHTQNAHFDGSGKPTLFDFEDFAYGWRAYDIAFFLGRAAVGWDRAAKAARTRRWNAFLEGYLGQRALSRSELQAAEVFVPIRQLWAIGFIFRHGIRYYGWHRIPETQLTENINFIRNWMHCYCR